MARSDRPRIATAGIENEVRKFLARYGAKLRVRTRAISAYAEMAAYNAVISHYRDLGYSVRARNLEKREFRYKVAVTGYPMNFSYFRVSTQLSGKRQSFDVHHNVAIESAHDEGNYLNVDIAVVRRSALKPIPDRKKFFAGSKRKYYAVANAQMCTFVEVKNTNPFAELLYGFTGLLYEMTPEVFNGEPATAAPAHLAPSLVCTFSASRAASRIIQSLKVRQRINIFVGVLCKSRLDDGSAEPIVTTGTRKRSGH